MDINRITLLDLEPAMVTAWQHAFSDVSCAEAHRADYFDVPADAMVSPANSFGIMDGGLDLAIRYELGHDIETRVQAEIQRTFHGELPVGTATIVETGNPKWPHLIVAPTMRMPMDVSNTLNAYLAFRAILNVVKQHNAAHQKNKIESFVCPGLATGVGHMSPQKSAHQMRLALDNLFAPAKTPSPQRIYSQNDSLNGEDISV